MIEWLGGVRLYWSSGRAFESLQHNTNDVNNGSVDPSKTAGKISCMAGLDIDFNQEK